MKIKIDVSYGTSTTKDNILEEEVPDNWNETDIEMFVKECVLNDVEWSWERSDSENDRNNE